MAGPVDDAPPATITVCRSSGAIETVPFKEYVKTVLPVEFYASWPRETVRAGAAVITSYAWYFVRHPISEQCDLGDTTRYQVYAPEKQRRTAVTDQAVEDIWHLRLWDPSRGDIAFAQYCSAGCRTHARNTGEGRYMDQDVARDLGAQGMTYLAMLQHFYRNLPIDISSWIDGLGLATDTKVIALDAPQPVVLRVAGVTPGDGRVQVAAWAVCTIEGTPTSRLLSVVPTASDGAGGTVARFDDLRAATECQDQEASVHFQLVVNNHAAITLAVNAWRTWTSAAPREVERVGNANDPVLASVQTSRATFDGREAQADGGNGVFGAVPGMDEEPVEATFAAFAVLARADAFPDALGATALAGMDGPLLLHPSGQGTRLDSTVRDELERILEPGATVHLVGGVNAISDEVAADVEALGFTTVRTSGGDRVATSIAIADRLGDVQGDDASGTVVLVRGFPNTTSGWADAVSVAPWAARTGTPILVTSPSALSPRVEKWIEDPANGIDEVIIIGGTAAVAGSAEGALDGVTVTRVSGARRDATALAVANELWGTRGTPSPAAAVAQNVFDATGWTAAVTGAALAAQRDAAAVSVWAQVPPSTTGLWLDGKAGLPVLVVGGTATVSDEVEAALAGA